MEEKIKYLPITEDFNDPKKVRAFFEKEENKNRLPENLLCAISCDMPKDPVFDKSGALCERAVLEEAANKRNNSSPFTGRPFVSEQLIKFNDYERHLGLFARSLTLERQIDAQKQTITENNAVIEQLHQETGALNNEKKQHEEEMSSAMATLTRFNEMLVRTREELDQSEKSRARTEKVPAKTRKELSKTRKLLQQREAFISEQEVIIANLKTEVGQVRTENTELKNENSDLKDKNVTLQLELNKQQCVNSGVNIEKAMQQYVTFDNLFKHRVPASVGVKVGRYDRQKTRLFEDTRTRLSNPQASAVSYQAFRTNMSFLNFRLDREYRITYYVTMDIHRRVLYLMNRWKVDRQAQSVSKMMLSNAQKFSFELLSNTCLYDITLRLDFIKTYGLIPDRAALIAHAEGKGISANQVLETLASTEFITATNDYIKALCEESAAKGAELRNLLTSLSQSCLNTAYDTLNVEGTYSISEDKDVIGKAIHQNRGYLDHCDLNQRAQRYYQQ